MPGRNDLGRPVRRVLVPTDVDQFHQDLAGAFRRRDVELIVGTGNFHLSDMAADVDVVKVLWPEELMGWSPPGPHELRRFEATLDAWSRRARVVAAVHNLWPHRHEGHPAFRRMYEVLYERSALILHHSQTSRELVNREFPVAGTRPYITTCLFNFDRLLGTVDREGARRSFGFSPKDFVILGFGAIRKWEEARLLMRGFDMTRLRGKRLLMASRYVAPGADARARLRRLTWRAWLRLVRARCAPGFVPDQEVHRYLTACDVVVVPRLCDMSSGLVPLAFTFGRAVVAPDHGAYPEYLAGTLNPLYSSGDAASLARALERAAHLDRERLEAENRRRADAWTWGQIVDDLLEGLGSRRADGRPTLAGQAGHAPEDHGHDQHGQERLEQGPGQAST